MQVPEYMERNFPGLALEPPLFYSWPYGLRFELNAENPGFTYQQAVMLRACALYEDVFRPTDVCWIVENSGEVITHGKSIRGRGLRYRRARRDLFQVSRKLNLGLRGVSGRLRTKYREDTTATRVSTLRWSSISPRRINYVAILQLLAMKDFSGWQPLWQDVFFINQSRNLIFHMYDDRGLDILAKSAEDLRGLYEVHGKWLLDYDRKRIDALYDPVEPRTTPPRFRD